jgi:uncharacterized membrane protein YphA (DoxX/SURF4 family)
MIRLILAAVFIVAGSVKIADPQGFATNIDNYRILPYPLVTVTAIVLPWLEVLLGVALLVGIWIRGASLWVVILNAIFLVAISSALIRGLDIECGCFSTGGEGTRIGIQKLLEDVVLLAGGLWLYVRTGVKQKRHHNAIRESW